VGLEAVLDDLDGVVNDCIAFLRVFISDVRESKGAGIDLFDEDVAERQDLFFWNTVVVHFCVAVNRTRFWILRSGGGSLFCRWTSLRR
jgi:hypothetical protein